MTATRSQRLVTREVAYAAIGLLLGVLAPIGWIILRLILFWQAGGGLGVQIVDDMVRSPQQIALYLYMGGGTALVLGAFGYFIGQATQQTSRPGPSSSTWSMPNWPNRKSARNAAFATSTAASRTSTSSTPTCKRASATMRSCDSRETVCTR